MSLNKILFIASALTPAVLASWYQPPVDIAWQYQLNGYPVDISISPDIILYDVDLFDISDEDIENLKNNGKKLICYFSAGSGENWRPDYVNYPAAALGNDLDGWPGEKWLDITNPGVLTVIEGRLDKAVDRKCDGVEPDNVDSYANNNGFSTTYAQQITFNKWLADQAHKRNLSVGLKNDNDQVPDLVDYFDFAIVESCVEYDECDTYAPFAATDKPVFGVEYIKDLKDIPSFCSVLNHENYSWITKTLDLNALPYCSCLIDACFNEDGNSVSSDATSLSPFWAVKTLFSHLL